MKRVTIPAVLSLLLLAGCNPVVNKVYLAGEQYPPRPANQPVQLYSDKLPECEFQELAIVTVKPGYESMSMDEVTEALRTTTREIGGDAVIRLQIGEVAKTEVKSNSTSTTVSTGSTMANSLTGTVIRFLKDDCRK